MNYYPFHVGDYAAHTKHLTLIGDLAYRRLLDLYYLNEGPLPLDPVECARKIGMRDHICDVSEVLSDFFLKSEDGYRSKRCDDEIASYRAKADRARQANEKRWAEKKSESVVKSDLKSDADQIPTNNQEPITNNQSINTEESADAPPAPAPAKPRKVEIAKPEHIDQQLWSDAMAIRKAKKLPLTMTAWTEMQAEFSKAGITEDEGLRACCRYSWASFNAQWYMDREGRQLPSAISIKESFSERDERKARERFEAFTGQRSDSVIDITNEQPRISA